MLKTGAVQRCVAEILAKAKELGESFGGLQRVVLLGVSHAPPKTARHRVDRRQFLLTQVPKDNEGLSGRRY